MSAEFEFDFNRFTRTFLPDEPIHVDMKIKTKEPIKAKECSCNVYCVRTVDPDGHGFSGFDISIPKPADRIVWQQNIPIKDQPSVIEDGFKFSFDFSVPRNSKMTESVRGKYISVDYFVEFNIKRGLLQSDLTGNRIFFVVYPPDKPPSGEPVDMIVDKIDVKRSMGHKANFKAHIHIDTPCASFTKPPRGYIEMLEEDTPVEAITVSYIRNEKITVERGNPQTLISEKNRTYIAENDPPLNTHIPFNLEWVRVHISPDAETPAFGITTSLKVRIVFTNGAYASATIPLKLYHDLAY